MESMGLLLSLVLQLLPILWNRVDQDMSIASCTTIVCIRQITPLAC